MHDVFCKDTGELLSLPYVLSLMSIINIVLAHYLVVVLVPPP